MATQTNVPQSNPRSETVIERLQAYRSDGPQVVPFPAPQAISQLELVTFLSLKGRLRQLEAQVEAAEQSINDRLEKGCSVEEGDHTAELKESFRRNVSWKDCATRLADKVYFGKA